MRCRRCGKKTEVVVSFGTPGEPETPNVCLKCLRRIGLDIVASVKRMAANSKVRAAREHKTQAESADG